MTPLSIGLLHLFISGSFQGHVLIFGGRITKIDRIFMDFTTVSLLPDAFCGCGTKLITDRYHDWSTRYCPKVCEIDYKSLGLH